MALPVLGGAVLFASCRPAAQPEPVDEENVVSRRMENMATVVTMNGKLTQRFDTPLLENYEFAKEPFEEYQKGIEFSSYDSLEVQSLGVVADYALHWTKRDLWELKGNVVAAGTEGRTLYTQQLFWDRKIKRFYSNVDSKVVEGDDVFIGEGFDADDDFGRWTFRKLKGVIGVDTEPAKPAQPDATADSTVVSSAGGGGAAVPDAGSGTEADAAVQDAGAPKPQPPERVRTVPGQPVPNLPESDQPVPLKLKTEDES